MTSNGHDSDRGRQFSISWRPSPFLALGLFALAACQAPISKPDAFSLEVLEHAPLPASLLTRVGKDEIELAVDSRWFADVRPREALTFVGLRDDDGVITFAVVLDCDVDGDLLSAAPLAAEETPLDVLGDARRRAELEAWPGRSESGERLAGQFELVLSRAVAERRFAPPLPAPRRIFGVAANYPSHLENDFASDWDEETRRRLTESRPRVFLKHPAVAPYGYRTAAELGFQGVVGAYDGIQHPPLIDVPLGEQGAGTPVPLRLDYEVEVGVVFTREFTAASVAQATDDEIRAAVGGYLLVSDAKARNPAAAARIARRGRNPGPDYGPYRPEHDELEERMGIWGSDICTFWSYAASYGNFSALGPLLVAAPAGGVRLPARAMVSARSYADAALRGARLPDDREPNVLYLRQCSATSLEQGFEDALVWDIPAVVRSILDPGTVIPFTSEEPQISPGDIVCLGTPGGTVVTVPSIPAFAPKMLFWFDPIDWHDKFFGKDEELYLREGDRVFYWVQGLGYQLHEVEVVDGPLR